LCLSQQLFEPIEADRLLADLRHEPEATSPDNATVHPRGARMSIGGFTKLFAVHGSQHFALVIDQSQLDRPAEQLRHVSHIQPSHQVESVHFDRAHADRQYFRNLTVRVPD